MAKKQIDSYLESKLYGKVEKYKALYKKIQNKLVRKGFAPYYVDEIIKGVISGKKILNDESLLTDIQNLNVISNEIESIKNSDLQRTEENIEKVQDLEVKENDTYEILKQQLSKLRSDIEYYLLKQGYDPRIIGMVIESLSTQMHLDSDKKLNDMILELIELENKMLRMEPEEKIEPFEYY